MCIKRNIFPQMWVSNQGIDLLKTMTRMNEWGNFSTWETLITLIVVFCNRSMIMLTISNQFAKDDPTISISYYDIVLREVDSASLFWLSLRSEKDKKPTNLEICSCRNRFPGLPIWLGEMPCFSWVRERPLLLRYLQFNFILLTLNSLRDQKQSVNNRVRWCPLFQIWNKTLCLSFCVGRNI